VDVEDLLAVLGDRGQAGTVTLISFQEVGQPWCEFGTE
jgi:hypothetical protein